MQLQLPLQHYVKRRQLKCKALMSSSFQKLEKQHYFFNSKQITTKTQIKVTKDTNIGPEAKVFMHGNVILIPASLTELLSLGCQSNAENTSTSDFQLIALRMKVLKPPGSYLPHISRTRFLTEVLLVNTVLQCSLKINILIIPRKGQLLLLQ